MTGKKQSIKLLLMPVEKQRKNIFGLDIIQATPAATLSQKLYLQSASLFWRCLGAATAGFMHNN